jgi:hypothetical protein
MRLCRFGKNRLGLVRADSVIDVAPVLDRLRVTVIRCPGTINGEPRQKANTRDLIIDVPVLSPSQRAFIP